MPVRVADATRIEIFGSCPIEDAEHLLRDLLANPLAGVDWRECDDAHTAVVQVLIAARVPIEGPPRGPALRAIVAPAIDLARKSS